MIESLQPLPYHIEIRDHLRSNHEDVWNWFSSAESESDFSDAVQLELLKSTYRMNREDHEALYALADEVKGVFELDVPVTLYQSQDGGGAGQAALYYTPGHGHVVFGGKILDLLDEGERKALLGHELAHFKLWTLQSGDFLVTDRILLQMVSDARAEPSHFESARLHRLYTEIFADRGGLIVSESAETGVSMLIKTVTGTSDVNPTRYLEQAEEVFTKSGAGLKSGEFSHPENFIRARAMKLWWDERADGKRGDERDAMAEAKSVEKEIERMIQGDWALDDLDLTRQEALASVTREFLRHFLKPKWVQTGRTLAHAKLYFADFKPDEATDIESMDELVEKLKNTDDKMRHYLTHLLLDFAVADRELDENGLALAFDVAEKIGVGDELEAAARKELKMLKRDVVAIRKSVKTRLEKAEAEHQKLSKKEKAKIAE